MDARQFSTAFYAFYAISMRFFSQKWLKKRMDIALMSLKAALPDL
jgi:hypothetical protein